jgi:transposase-like protein
MTADIGNDAESSKKRGRIPQSAWPQIVDRYRSGATLSAIAREYECTPSAISYIIRKAEAAGVEPGGLSDEAEDAAEDAGSVETAAPPVAAPASPPAPVPPPAPPAQQTLRLNPQPRERDPEPEPPRTAPPPVVAPAPASQPSAQAAPQPGGARPEPTPPLDAVEARLRETARGCLAAYRGWRQTPGETSIQTLSDAVHELRKALARVEIDMSASRRDEQAIRPIPIPAHRASRRPQ